MKRIIWPAPVLAVVFLAGCGAQQVSLNYTGSEAEGNQAVQAANVQGKKIYLVPFEDQRPDKQDIGGLKNAYGYEAQDVLLTNDPGETVTSAIKQELERAGYSIVLADEGDQNTDAPTLGGNVIEIACCDNAQGQRLSYSSKIILNARMAENGNERIDSVYIGEGSKGALFGGQDIYEQAMSNALGNAVQKLIVDVNNEAL